MRVDKVEWKYPEGMTLGEFRALTQQIESFPDDAKVMVSIKFGGQIKTLRVEASR